MKELPRGLSMAQLRVIRALREGGKIVLTCAQTYRLVYVDGDSRTLARGTATALISLEVVEPTTPPHRTPKEYRIRSIYQ